MAVLEHHYSDPYQNEHALARISYYGISGYPTAKFDGILQVVGGDACPPPFDTYDSYYPVYAERITVGSPFLMDIAGLTALGNHEYQLNIHIEKVDPAILQNLKLHVAITESHIPENWQCLHEVNYVTRSMAPNAGGTDLDFSVSNELTIPLYFMVNPAWNFDHLELVAFIQENTTKEIFQAIKAPIPEHNLDVELTDLSNIPDGNCSGEIRPSFLLTNQGGTTITSLTINYQLNGGEVSTYLWTGELSFKESEVVLLDPMEFMPSGNDMFMVTGSDPNGLPDENPMNNTLAKEFGNAFETSFFKIALTLQTDGAPQQTTYEVLNSVGDVLYSGGPYEAPYSLLRDTFELMTSDCYRFVIHDQGCNGLNGGFYLLREAFAGGSMIHSGGIFDCLETTEFHVNWVGMDDPFSFHSTVRVFPNPFSEQTTFYIDLQRGQPVTIQIFDPLGMKVHDKNLGLLPAGEHAIVWSRDHLAGGMYFYRIITGAHQYTDKMIIEN